MKEETPSAPAVTELVSEADDNLTAEAVESLIGTALNETVDESSGVEVKEETLSAPVVTELVTQAAETLAVETDESLMDADVSETVDASSGVDMKEETLSAPLVSELITQAADTIAVVTVENLIETDICNILAVASSSVEAVTEETDESNTQSTFLTEIEDAGETHMEERKTEELGQLDQFEKSIAESEKDFPTEQIIGEIKGDVESIKEGEPLPDMTTENIDIINEENKDYQEKLIEPLIVDSTAEETPENNEILDEAKEELKDIEPIPEESIENAVEKPSLNIEDTKEAEKIPILTIFMIAYVVFMALLVFCH